MSPNKLWSFAVSSALASLGLTLLLSATTASVVARQLPPVVATGPDDASLRAMFEEDRSDRAAVVEGKKSEAVVRTSESVRLKKTRRLVRRHSLHSANDYFRAAAILQRSDSPEEIMLARDLASTAVDLGQHDAAKVAASAEDRFLRCGIGGSWVASDSLFHR